MAIALGAVTLGLAASAVGAAAQSPEFGECAKVPLEGKIAHGGYSNATCTKESTGKDGKYEGYRGVREPDFTVIGGATKLESTTRTRVSCKSASVTGKFAGTESIIGLEVVLSGCQLGEAACTTAGAEAGQIATSPLDAALGYTEQKANRAALEVFTPEEEPFLEAQCGATSIAIHGSLLVPVTLDKASTKMKLKFSGKKGIQTPSSLEGAPERSLQLSVNGGTFGRAGLSGSWTLISRANTAPFNNNVLHWSRWFAVPSFAAPHAGTFLLTNREQLGGVEHIELLAGGGQGSMGATKGVCAASTYPASATPAAAENRSLRSK